MKLEAHIKKQNKQNELKRKKKNKKPSHMELCH